MKDGMRRPRLAAMTLLGAAVACSQAGLNLVGDSPGEGAAGADTAPSDAGEPSLGGSGSDRSAGGAGQTPAGEGGTYSTTLGGAFVMPDGGVPNDWGGMPGNLIGELSCWGCDIQWGFDDDIRAVATASDRAYFVHYGTTDEVGNTKSDGALRAVPITGDDPETISSGLQGPIELEIGELFAYVILEQSSDPSGAVQLARISLDGGQLELLQPLPANLGGQPNLPVTDWFHRFFAYGQSTAYWVNAGKVWRLPEASNGPPEVWLEKPNLLAITADARSVYYMDPQGVWFLPHSGAKTTIFRPMDGLVDLKDGGDPVPAYHALTMFNGYIFGVEAEHPYLARLSTTGGTWERQQYLQQMPTQVVVSGDHYVADLGVFDENGKLVGCSLVAGTLSDPDPHEKLAESPLWSANAESNHWRAWDATTSAVFFAWQGSMNRLPRP